MDTTRRSSTEPIPPPSLTLSGVSTRSKYHLRHRNPTGHFQSSSADCQSDSVIYSSDDDDDRMLVSDLWKKAKLSQDSSVKDDGDPPHILIKDLRARRVYSPQSVGVSFSYSSPNVDNVESKVRSSCGYLEMVDSGSGSASTEENNGRAGEVSKRDGEIAGLDERLPSEGRSKDGINSILFSVAKEYRSEKDDDLYSDCAFNTTNRETESPAVGFPHKAQKMDHADHESVGESKHFNSYHDGTGAFERLDNANEVPKLRTPPDDIETCGTVKFDKDRGKQVEAFHIKDTQLTRNTDGKAEESLCPNADIKNDSLKNKYVLRPRMQRKLFKSPGSVSYRRLLPFIMNMIKDDSGTTILGRRQNDEKVNDAKQFQFPSPSPSQEASTNQLRANSRPRNDNNDGNESKLSSYQDLPESPKQSSAKEVVCDCSSVPSVNEHIKNVVISLECSSSIKAEEVVDVHYDKNVANAVPSKVHGCKAEAIEGVDTSDEHCAMNQQCSSLPDADICGENKNIPCSTDVVNTLDLTPSTQANAGEGFCSHATKGKDDVLRSKSVLKPCLQRKLFKTPGSVSYKRLLPFLKDIAKDDCGAPKLGHDQKDERGMRPQLPLLLQSQESTIDELKTDRCPIHDTVEVNAIQDTTTVDTLFNGDCNLECSPNLPNSVAKIDSLFLPSIPIMNVMPGEHSTSASLQLSVYGEAKRDSSNGEMPLNTNLQSQELQMKALDKHTIPAVGLKKGILKRNPRGCRGLCTCLNCASFRLHAERAFEFSRNQFLDAEEVALDLMKELSHLRNMLERRNDGANNYSVLDENQVKEACLKAFAAEQSAKERLSQMNDDLNIHSRITAGCPCKSSKYDFQASNK
ncbi:uncharacterized protein LOC129308139 isoform X2 [Prosopis cineraria]|uniref:uncharacterized protein LOC129308139 isoform X2 n=1 Tax=Prosopis cineraria TaxID=364024 RepID=UPI00240F5096|nr:uncharacterized protein LOC129308139 isoform X2 [Prosopis cineraria]